MITVSKEFKISQPVEKVWDVISNFGEIYQYHPEVAKSHMLSDKTKGLGAVRKCVFNNGGSAIEKIIEWEDGAALAVELSEMSLPFVFASGFNYIKPIDDKSTQITIGMNYIFKYGIIGAFVGKFVMKPMLGKTFGKAAKSIEYFIINGKKIS